MSALRWGPLDLAYLARGALAASRFASAGQGGRRQHAREEARQGSIAEVGSTGVHDVMHAFVVT
eukprot:3442838-Pyramimonas_sp.AAC.1